MIDYFDGYSDALLDADLIRAEHRDRMAMIKRKRVKNAFQRLFGLACLAVGVLLWVYTISAFFSVFWIFEGVYWIVDTLR